MDDTHGISDGNINISDVIEVIQTTDPEFGMEDTRVTPSNNSRSAPYIKIIEQPASKALRFRYECEGRSAGSIPGVNSTPDSKTYPSIQVVGYTGPFYVVVSCVTKDTPHRPHPHNLVGKDGCSRGVYSMKITSGETTVTFANLGIQCVKRKDIEDALRIREELRVDPFGTGFDHKRHPTSIDLNAVRLCFQVFVEGREKGRFKVPLQPVVSDPIFDKKAMSDLAICKLSHCSASVAGGMEMILLCEKVAKEDIQVRFFEVQKGQLVWEGFGDFQPTHVHKQVAIAFRTPSYRTQQIDQPVQVNIQLRRPSDGVAGEALPFQMLPLGAGRPAFWSLRKAFTRKKADYNAFGQILATEASMFPNSTPKSPRDIDEFNNNHDFGIKRSQDKMSALRALNDLYRAKNSVESRNGDNAFKSRSSIAGFQNHDVPPTDPQAKLIEPREVLENNGNLSGFQQISNTFDGDKGDAQMADLRVKEPKCGDLSSRNRSDWFDYSEVGKWVQRGQEAFKEKVEQVEVKDATENGSKSFNELLSQVAELDQIYADTHAKLLNAALDETVDRRMEVDVCDNQTYTSLQMAMKNPIDLFDVQDEKRYEDVAISNRESIVIGSAAPPLPPPHPPALAAKRDVTREFEERVPPLPPKRIRKMSSMPVLTRPVSAHTLTDTNNATSAEAPHKNLPSPPGTLPKQSKQGLFSKLFAKKSKKDKDSSLSINRDSNQSLNVGGSISSLCKPNTQEFGSSPSQQGLPRPSVASVTSVKSLKLDDDETSSQGLELTEAEHYALYTAMAPHATASEFDEMSFYYSPVEGGEILTNRVET